MAAPNCITMLKSFLDRLNGQSPTAPDPTDERTAVAALLVNAARVDQDYTDTEKGLIEAILAHRCEMAPADAEALRLEGEEAEAAAVDNFRFGQVIRDSLPEPDRVPVVEALWSVVLSDETRDAQENEIVRRVVKILDIEPRESVLARQRVEAAMKG